MVVGLRVDLHGVGMLQSVGSCRDSDHELSGVVWCRMGCRYSVVKLFGGLCVFVVVVMMVVGTVLAVLCCGCVVFGSGEGGGGGSSSVVKLFGGRGAIVVVSSNG